MHNPLHTKKKPVWPYLLGTIIGLLLLVAFALYRFTQNITPERLLENDLIRHEIEKRVGEENTSLIAQAPIFLGFGEPKTYLILFLNNTELRPGGGFIGSYATVRFKNGKPEILALEGTERLDARTPDTWIVEPPQLLNTYLGVARWFFRDSNWSPDYPINAQRALEFYAGEGGVAADEIDAVFSFTPTVLEEILKITGPFEIQGIRFESETVTEKLEYEVEYGYKDRGIAFADRKQIMKPFFEELLAHISETIFVSPKQYIDLVLKMFSEKQILVYSKSEDINDALRLYDPFGTVDTGRDTDYIMWNDANLAALKTDHAMKRDVRYTIKKENNAYIGELSMHYQNEGTFDWRTTRYRTYARVYIPDGAQLQEAYTEAEGNKTILSSTELDTGVDFEKLWYGVFTTIEPGDEQTVVFRYVLPKRIAKDIEEGEYELIIQKQPGAKNYGLSLLLDFGKQISGAEPSEDEAHWGDSVYQLETQLNQDKHIDVTF